MNLACFYKFLIIIIISDGDRKAYLESSQMAMKKNKEVIATLRHDNKKLHKQLAVAKGRL